MNKTTVHGTLGRDAELQPINGKNYAKFSILSDKYKDKDGKEVAEWLDCLKLDENGKLTPYLKKGVPIYAEGKLRANAYLKDGTPTANLTLWINHFDFINYPKVKDDKPVQDQAENQGEDLPF